MRFLHPGLHGNGNVKTFVPRSNFFRFMCIEWWASRMARENSGKKDLNNLSNSTFFLHFSEVLYFNFCLRRPKNLCLVCLLVNLAPSTDAEFFKGLAFTVENISGYASNCDLGLGLQPLICLWSSYPKDVSAFYGNRNQPHKNYSISRVTISGILNFTFSSHLFAVRSTQFFAGTSGTTCS